MEHDERVCKNCEWWVNEEDDDIGNFTHRAAIETGKGFCLIRDLYTYTDMDFYCRGFRRQDEKQ
jgi:hypothetical protein